MAGGSSKAVVTALCANVGIGIAKFVGASISGSASMFAEGVHSLVDSGNQALLLFGAKVSKKPADERHPLGYGREAFFWSFMVAIFLFSLGGLFAVYEGMHKLAHPEPITAPWLGLGIFAFAIVLETFALRVCIQEIRAIYPKGSLLHWFKKTKSSELMVILTEDAAALVGLVIASICVLAAWITGDPAWDARGSILIGLVLIIVAFLLALEVKSLLIGEAASEDFKTPLQELLNKHLPGSKVLRIIALQTGAHEVLLSSKISIGDTASAQELTKGINLVETELKSRFPQLRWQFVEPDSEA
jgi:cation diffusion facilitator family transporter